MKLGGLTPPSGRTSTSPIICGLLRLCLTPVCLELKCDVYWCHFEPKSGGYRHNFVSPSSTLSAVQSIGTQEHTELSKCGLRI